jgi:hypothetical protein
MNKNLSIRRLGLRNFRIRINQAKNPEPVMEIIERFVLEQYGPTVTTRVISCSFDQVVVQTSNGVAIQVVKEGVPA